MIKQRICYVAALMGSIALVICYQEWMSVLFLALALCLPLLSLAVSLPAMLRFRVSLRYVEAVTVGETSTAELVGDGDLPFRARLRLCRIITEEVWYGGIRVAVPTDHVGAVTVTPTRVRVYDRLGLIGWWVKCPQTATVLVRPKAIRTELPADAQNVTSTSLRPKAGGGYSEYHELRPYRPGDSLNHIHWKVTAKVGSPILREPMQPDLRWQIAFNIRGDAAALDTIFGHLVYVGEHFLFHGIPFEIRALSGGGLMKYPVLHEWDLQTAVDSLLAAPPAKTGSVRDYAAIGFRVLMIGGDDDEA